VLDRASPPSVVSFDFTVLPRLRRPLPELALRRTHAVRWELRARVDGGCIEPEIVRGALHVVHFGDVVVATVAELMRGCLIGGSGIACKRIIPTIVAGQEPFGCVKRLAGCFFWWRGGRRIFDGVRVCSAADVEAPFLFHGGLTYASVAHVFEGVATTLLAILAADEFQTEFVAFVLRAAWGRGALALAAGLEVLVR